MRKKSNHFLQQGQALVTLLFFVVIATTITSASVVVILNSSISTSKFEQGNVAYFVAESGVENALIRLLRNTKYCGEVLPVDVGSATITVVDTNNSCNGVSPFTITVVGKQGNFLRTIQVHVQYDVNGLSILSWKEV